MSIVGSLLGETLGSILGDVDLSASVSDVPVFVTIEILNPHADVEGPFLDAIRRMQPREISFVEGLTVDIVDQSPTTTVEMAEK